MFGSKKRAQIKEIKARIAQAKLDMADEAAYMKKNADITAKQRQETEVFKKYVPNEYNPQHQGYGVYSVPTDKPTQKTHEWPMSSTTGESPRPGYDAMSEDEEPETIIDGTLGNGVKFHLDFDAESTKKNLQMIVAVLNLHIAEFLTAEAKIANDAALSKQERSTAEYNANIRKDKLDKEFREHELKVIAAKKEANLPLATSPSNGQIGNVSSQFAGNGVGLGGGNGSSGLNYGR